MNLADFKILDGVSSKSTGLGVGHKDAEMYFRVTVIIG